MKKISIITLIIVITDQLIKLLIQNNLINFSIFNNFLSIVKTYNYGAAFGIFTSQKILLIVVSLTILIVLIKEFLKESNKINKLSLSFMIAGLLGNLIDRVIRGYVVDYIKINLFDFPIFNLADIFIVIGTFMYVFIMFKKEQKDEVNS